MLHTVIGVIVMLAGVVIAAAVFAQVRRRNVAERNRAAALAALEGRAGEDAKGSGERFGALKDRLEKAGIDLPPAYFLATVLFLTVAVAYLGAALTANAGAALIGLVVPVLAVLMTGRNAKSTAGEFEAQLAEALPMVAGGMRTGLTFEASLRNVADFMPDPLSTQFKRVADERAMGVPLADAMEHMAARVDSDDLGLLTAVTAVQSETGGNMADVLDSISQTIRSRMRMRKHLSSVTAEGRLGAAIIGLVPIVLLIALCAINQTYRDVFFGQPVGWVMLGAAALLDAAGYIAVRKLYDMKIY